MAKRKQTAGQALAAKRWDKATIEDRARQGEVARQSTIKRQAKRTAGGIAPELDRASATRCPHTMQPCWCNEIGSNDEPPLDSTDD